MSLLDNYEQTNKYTSFIVCIPTAWENNFPFEKESTVCVAFSITRRGIKTIFKRDTKVSTDSHHACLRWHL